MADPVNAAKPPTDPPGQSVSLVSAPLDEAADVVGLPQVRVRLGSASGELAVFVKLFDIAPDGAQVMIKEARDWAGQAVSQLRRSSTRRAGSLASW